MKSVRNATFESVERDLNEASASAITPPPFFDAMIRNELREEAIVSICEIAALALRHSADTSHEDAFLPCGRTTTRRSVQKDHFQ